MIGFSQRVRLEWMEAAARLVGCGKDWTAIQSSLDELLRERVSVQGDAERGNRQKILTILKKIWYDPPKCAKPLRLRALKWLAELPEDQHLAIHWGMTTAAYPFWSVTALQVGRLLGLQGTVTARQVQMRLLEQYGDRETVARAARRILRTYHDWGVLAETGNPGLYKAARTVEVTQPEVANWLVEAMLRAGHEPAVAVHDVHRHPQLFPFQLTAWSTRFIREAGQFELRADGSGEEWVCLS